MGLTYTSQTSSPSPDQGPGPHDECGVSLLAKHVCLPRCDRGSPPHRDCGAEGRREREQEKRPCGHTFHRHVPGGCGADALQDPEPRENSGHERPRPGSAASSAGSLETVGRSSLRVGFPIRSQRFGAEQPLSPTAPGPNMLPAPHPRQPGRFVHEHF